VPFTLPTEQKELLALVDRRHPRYAERLAHWLFCRATHDGGRDWFLTNIFRYLKEGNREFRDRLRRAYRFNHTREVVRLVTKYIFKSGVIRNLEETPKELRRFWKHTTVKGAGIDEFMRRASDLASIYGRVWLVVDSDVPADVLTRADEQSGRSRLFAYTVTPEDMLDYAWDDHGELLWALWRVTYRDDADPVLSSGAVLPRYMLWTREGFAVLQEHAGRRREERQIEVIRVGDNPIGQVPLVPLDEQESDDPYDVPGLIADIAYLDRAVANYVSNLDAIIQDQTFSQLAMPGQGLLPGEDAYNKVLEMGTKRVFIYDGEASSGPEYISPDASQAQVILGTINKIIAEIYHSVGLAGERTKQDNAVGIDNSSGVAKAYDFERVNSLLAGKADVLERAEDRLLALAALWIGVKLPRGEDDEVKDLVKYPDSFDVRSLYDEFEIAENLALLEAPDEVRREQMRTLVAKMFPRHPRAKLEAMEKDVAAWPPRAEIAPAGSPFDQPTPGRRPVGSQPRQGQVTADTDTE
jgi:hypothetical protein